jgi:histidinol phosphatase-like PHP family hydrolase
MRERGPTLVNGGSALGSQDLHVHTSMSDGDLPLERVVQIARDRGVVVGIADHISTRNLERFVSSARAVERYLDALDGAPVFRSGEFCWCDELWASLSDEVRERFDYRVGSNHGFWLPDGSMASPWWQRLPAAWAGRPGELIDVMVRNLCDLVRSMPIEIVAHSTLLPPAVLALEPDVEAWWTEEREDRFIDAVVASGVAVEISNRYRLPHPRFLRKAREAGACFSLGSDGHTAAQVARLGWATEAARGAGITDAAMFVPERATAGSRT